MQTIEFYKDAKGRKFSRERIIFLINSTEQQDECMQNESQSLSHATSRN